MLWESVMLSLDVATVRLAGLDAIATLVSFRHCSLITADRNAYIVSKYQTYL